jgi:hypothetical protein
VNESESRRIVDDGVISFEQAEGISGERYRLPDWSGGRTVEWLMYLAAGALFLCTVLSVFDALDFQAIALFDPAGQLPNLHAGLVALVGAVVLLFGGWLVSRSSDRAAKRASGFVLLLGFVAGAIATDLLLLDLDIKDFTPIVTVLPIIVLAVFVWRAHPALPTQLALFFMVTQLVSAFLVLFQVVDRPDFSTMVASVALGGVPTIAQGWVPALVDIAVGLLWMAMGSAGTLRPRNTAFAIGALYAGGSGLNLFGTGDGWIAVSILLSVLFVWMAVSRRSSVLGGIGAVSVLVLIAQVMSLVTDMPTLRDYEIWYGVPGLVALGLALMLGNRGAVASTRDATPPAS